MITKELLKAKLSYEPLNGEFTWKRLGIKAGTINKNGYVMIKINRKLYPAHRLAWLYIHGEMPIEMIDHINRNRADNRISNLREATRKQNAINTNISRCNKSGFKGVSFHEAKGKYRAQCVINGKNKHLGYFPTAELASQVYAEASKRVNGEFVAS